MQKKHISTYNMDSNNKLIYFGILPGLLIVIIIFFVFIKVNSAEEEMIEYILPMTFSGHIVDKIIDYNNHATKSVIIKGQDSLKTVLYDSFWYPIYDSAEIGDSIYKNDGSLSLFIVDNDKNEKEIKYKPSTLYFHKRKWNKK